LGYRRANEKNTGMFLISMGIANVFGEHLRSRMSQIYMTFTNWGRRTISLKEKSSVRLGTERSRTPHI